MSNKQSSFQWFETPQSPCVIIVMTNMLHLSYSLTLAQRVINTLNAILNDVFTESSFIYMRYRRKVQHTYVHIQLFCQAKCCISHCVSMDCKCIVYIVNVKAIYVYLDLVQVKAKQNTNSLWHNYLSKLHELYKSVSFGSYGMWAVVPWQDNFLYWDPFCSYPSYYKVIAMKFCIWHDTCTVVSCAIFAASWYHMIELY